MGTKKEVTFGQFELLECMMNTPGMLLEDIPNKLGTDIPLSEIEKELSLLIRWGYLSNIAEGYFTTDRGDRIVDEYYLHLDESGDGFEANPGTCDDCGEIVDCRVLFKGEELCSKCLCPEY